MGTHPIFESDFDCLTVQRNRIPKLTMSDIEIEAEEPQQWSDEVEQVAEMPAVTVTRSTFPTLPAATRLNAFARLSAPSSSVCQLFDDARPQQRKEADDGS